MQVLIDLFRVHVDFVVTLSSAARQNHGAEDSTGGPSLAKGKARPPGDVRKSLLDVASAALPTVQHDLHVALLLLPRVLLAYVSQPGLAVYN